MGRLTHARILDAGLPRERVTHAQGGTRPTLGRVRPRAGDSAIDQERGGGRSGEKAGAAGNARAACETTVTEATLRRFVETTGAAIGARSPARAADEVSAVPRTLQRALPDAV